MSHGQLYPNLDTLVEQQLIEKGQQDERTNYYEITAKGKNLLIQRRKWENNHIEFL